MGVVIEREEWALTPLAYPLLSASSLAAVLLLPYFSPSHTASTAAASSSSPFDVGTTPFLRFRRAFLFLFSLASVVEGIQSVFGEDEFVRCGLGREQMASRLAASVAATLFLGGVSGVISDKLGPRRACIFYWILQLAVGAMKSFSGLRCAWINNFILALASSMFSICFETWIVVEHEKQGQKQDLLFDTFWLMTFFESVSFVGSQGITNLLVENGNKGFLLPYAFAALLSIIGSLYIKNSSSTSQPASVIGSYQKSFVAHVLRDKRVLILVFAQACIHFSVAAFWFLWAPTILADGRDAQLSLIYPCFFASRMLGSASFPWFYGATAPFQNEDSLAIAYIAAGFVLSIVAYDYQEIGTMVVLFCIFHAFVGFILPSLARLRTMYLPNELRGGMMSFSLALANAPIFIFLIQGAYHRNIANSTILGLAACGLLAAGGCIHMLRRWRKHTRQNTLPDDNITNVLITGAAYQKKPKRLKNLQLIQSKISSTLRKSHLIETPTTTTWLLDQMVVKMVKLRPEPSVACLWAKRMDPLRLLLLPHLSFILYSELCNVMVLCPFCIIVGPKLQIWGLTTIRSTTRSTIRRVCYLLMVCYVIHYAVVCDVCE